MSNIDEHEEEISELEQTLRTASEFVFNTGLYAQNSITLTNISTNENPLPIMTDWGDGVINSNLTHNYTERGTYTVRTFATIGSNTNSMVCLKKVNKLHNMEYDINVIKDIIKCENLEYLDMSNITLKYDSDNLNGLFMNCSSLRDIRMANWNTNGLISINNMFNGCTSLEHVDLNMWDMSNINDMSYMFSNCSSLEELELEFNTINLINASYIFYECSSLKRLILSNWNTENVTNISYIFYNCSSLEYLDISSWNTCNINTYSNMLYGVPKIKNKNWNYNGDNYNDFLLSEIQTGYIGTFPWSFTVTYDVKKEIRFKTIEDYKENYIPKINNLYPDKQDIFLFLKDGSVTNDLNTYIVLVDYITIRALQNIEIINFSNTFITKIEKIVTKKLKSMHKMFSGCQYLEEVNFSDWNITNVTDMSYMFSECKNLKNINLSNWNTVNVINMNYMFNKCSVLENIYILDFDLNNTTTVNMFSNIPEVSVYGWNYDGGDSCNNLKKLKESITDYSYIFPWNKYVMEYNIKVRDILDTVSYQYDSTKSSYLPFINSMLPSEKDILLVLKDGTFTNKLDTLVNDISIIKIIYAANTSSITFEGYDEKNCCFISHLGVIDISPLVTMHKMFKNCCYLESLDMYRWITTNINDMSYMFSGCINLKNVIIDWDTIKVTDMNNMFSKCSSLEKLDLSSFNTSNVRDMSNMFNHCSSLVELQITAYDQFKHNKINWWNTSSLENMQYIFANCSSLESLDVSDWNLSNVSNIQYIFWECEKLKSLDISKWNVSNVVNMDGVFSGCETLDEIDINDWDTSNVVTMFGMFENCKSLQSISINKLNTGSVINMASLFRNCHLISSLDLSKWNVSNVTFIKCMFENCYMLKNLNLSTWDTTKVKDSRYMFKNTVIDDWNYDKNYSKFSLFELNTDYKGIFPWSEEGYIKYKIIRKDKYSDSITAGSNHSNHRYYIPRLYTSSTSFFYPDNMTFKLVNGEETNDMSVPIDNIDFIRIKFNKKSITAIKFYSSEKDYCCITEVTDLNGIMLDMSNMFRNCIYLEKVNLLECDLKDTLNISNIFFNCNSIEYIETNYDEDVISTIDYSHNFPYNKIKGVE